MGKQVRSLNRICRCSDSLSKMCSRGPLLSEHRRHRSVNAVKLRSSGSVIAKHLMRRSRRQELSMYTAVVFGWRETSTHVAALGEASRRRCVRGALGPALPARPLRPSTPRTPGDPPRLPGDPPPATRGGGSDAPENACQFSRLQLPIVLIMTS